MRYMMMIKSDEWAEADQLPSPELIAAMEKYNAELIDAGAFVTAEGLKSSRHGARLVLHNGKRVRTDGPFAEAKEVIAGYWIIDVASKAEALDWAMRIPFEADTEANRIGEVGEVEVRRVFGLEDFPVNENESGWREQEAEWQEQPTISPVDPTKKRFFCIANGDESTEAGEMPSEELLAAMGAYMGEQAAKGIALGGEGLAPTSEGFKVRFQNGARTVTDGPFLETKEIVAGFGIIQAASLEEAIELGWEFLEVGSQFDPSISNRCEIREIFDISDFPAEITEQNSDASLADSLNRA